MESCKKGIMKRSSELWKLTFLFRVSDLNYEDNYMAEVGGNAALGYQGRGTAQNDKNQSSPLANI